MKTAKTSLLLLLFLGGCQSRMTYDIQVTTKNAKPLSDVDVIFEGDKLEFLVGILANGYSSTYVGVDGMPPIPKTLTVDWRDETGKKSVVVNVPENIYSRSSIQHGTLEVTIDGETVTIGFRE